MLLLVTWYGGLDGGKTSTMIERHSLKLKMSATQSNSLLEASYECIYEAVLSLCATTACPTCTARRSYIRFVKCYIKDHLLRPELHICPGMFTCIVSAQPVTAALSS